VMTRQTRAFDWYITCSFARPDSAARDYPTLANKHRAIYRRSQRCLSVDPDTGHRGS
jgi:hypothetical protein